MARKNQVDLRGADLGELRNLGNPRNAVVNGTDGSMPLVNYIIPAAPQFRDLVDFYEIVQKIGNTLGLDTTGWGTGPVGGYGTGEEALADALVEALGGINEGSIGDVVNLKAGNDLINAGSGNDIVFGGKGNDQLRGDDGTDILFGEKGNDVLRGGAGDDFLFGGKDNDVLDGGTGADYMAGGTGDDTYKVDNVGDTVVEKSDQGNDTLIWDLVDKLDLEELPYVNIENATLGPLGTNLAGDEFNNVLIGNESDNTITGRAGDDFIDGKGGNDTLIGDGGDDGNDEIHGGDDNDTIYGDNVDGSETGDDMDDDLHGDSGDDTIIGGDGADVIDGGTGDETDGDTASYFNADTGVTVDLSLGGGGGGGIAQTSVGSDANGDKLTDIENLIGSGYNDTLTGDDGANVIDGGDGDDLIEGGAGGDAIDGGPGNVGETDGDTASYANSDAAVDVDLLANTASGGHADGDTLDNIENLIGSIHNDTLTGDDGVNSIAGGDGDDKIEGGDSGDVINGGAGTDTASYANAGEAVTVHLNHNAGHAGDADGDTFIDIENLIGSDYNDRLIGDSGANTITGLAGDDIIKGKGGNDLLIGDGVADGQDTINGNGGNDVIYGDNVDGSETGGAGSDDELYGDGGNDTIIGGDGGDVINGGAGTDTASYANAGGRVTVSLMFGQGSFGDALGDTFTSIENVIGSDYNDIILGDFGNNVIDGGAGDDLLHGEGGSDTLNGGAGDDTLEGEGGADVLDGGADNDTASYMWSGGGVTVDLAAGTGVGWDAEGDTLANIENLIGSDYVDTLTGDDGANVIDGGYGVDLIVGGDGGDTLFGGTGGDNDTINAGTTGGSNGRDGDVDTIVAAASFAANGTDSVFNYEESTWPGLVTDDVFDFTDFITFTGNPLLYDDELAGFITFEENVVDPTTQNSTDTGNIVDSSTNVWFTVSELDESNTFNAAESVTVLVGTTEFFWNAAADQWDFA